MEKLAPYDQPEPLYCDLCGKKMSGDEVDNGFCESCKEHVDGVSWLEAPTQESERSGVKVMNKVFADINQIFKKAV